MCIKNNYTGHLKSALTFTDFSNSFTFLFTFDRGAYFYRSPEVFIARSGFSIFLHISAVYNPYPECFKISLKTVLLFARETQNQVSSGYRYESVVFF